MPKIRFVGTLAAGAGLAALTLLLARAPGAQTAAPDQVAAAAVRLASLGEAVLPPYYVEAALGSPSGQALVEGAAKTAAAGRIDSPMVVARRVLTALEERFIHDPNASTLDLLPPAERDRYRTFAWDPNDYPGGPEGPHENAALALDAALTRIRPERRANSTPAAVVRQEEFDDAMWKYIQGRRRPVPGQDARKLDRDALVSFVMMREAAKRDGVDIFILCISPPEMLSLLLPRLI
jgi:hypothetical protein